MGRLSDKLSDAGSVALDTSVLIYYLNRSDPYFAKCREVLREIETGSLRGVISVITEMELMVAPLGEDRREIVKAIDDLLRRLGLQIVPVDSGLARQAAGLRAETRLRSIDALVATTAMSTGCRFLLGNDREFARRVAGIEYLLLADYV